MAKIKTEEPLNPDGGLAESMAREFGEEALRGAATRIEVYELIDRLSDAIQMLQGRVVALEEAATGPGTGR